MLAIVGLAARLGAADAPALVPPMPGTAEAAPLSPVPSAVPSALPTPPPKALPAAAPAPAGAALALSPPAAAWPDHGVEYRFSLGQLWVYNAQPLSYVPIEIGWRFSNGVRVRTAIEAFYYDGPDKDATQGGQTAWYTYSMNNWRTSLLYEYPWTRHLRPLMGVTIEAMWGSRQYSSVPANTANPSSAAWSGFGPGALLGLQWQVGPHWGLSVTGRYLLLLGAPANVGAVDLGWDYLF
jgi:hypothetical protein